MTSCELLASGSLLPSVYRSCPASASISASRAPRDLPSAPILPSRTAGPSNASVLQRVRRRSRHSLPLASAVPLRTTRQLPVTCVRRPSLARRAATQQVCALRFLLARQTHRSVPLRTPAPLVLRRGSTRQSSSRPFAVRHPPSPAAFVFGWRRLSQRRPARAVPHRPARGTQAGPSNRLARLPPVATPLAVWLANRYCRLTESLPLQHLLVVPAR